VLSSGHDDLHKLKRKEKPKGVTRPRLSDEHSKGKRVTGGYKTLSSAARLERKAMESGKKIQRVRSTGAPSTNMKPTTGKGELEGNALQRGIMKESQKKARGGRRKV